MSSNHSRCALDLPVALVALRRHVLVPIDGRHAKLGSAANTAEGSPLPNAHAIETSWCGCWSYKGAAGKHSCFTLPAGLLPAGRLSCPPSFDAVDKVDPHNTQLMEAMWGYFSHNMEVVHYWLSMCVLPQETKQYPSRLEANAWHLVANPTGNVAGFSGTNDNHRLLPSQVQQVVLDDAPELEGTNGKMLDMLIKHASYATLQAATPRGGQQQVSNTIGGGMQPSDACRGLATFTAGSRLHLPGWCARSTAWQLLIR